MVNYQKIRISNEFRELIDYIRAKCILYGIKCPSITDITKIIAESMDKERLWQNEFFKK